MPLNKETEILIRQPQLWIATLSACNDIYGVCFRSLFHIQIEDMESSYVSHLCKDESEDGSTEIACLC